MPGQFTGSIIRRYTVDVAALPGQVTQRRHDVHQDDSAPEDNRDRDTAPLGGGWVPDTWTDGQVPVLPGSLVSEDPDHGNHRASGRHAGPDGRGNARPVNQDDEKKSRQPGEQNPRQTLATAGAGGAAFGGLRKTGSMDPYANPGGVDLGHRYDHPQDTHKQGLHFNRPGLRLIRGPQRTAAAYTTFNSGAGPSQPRLRRQLRPAGQTDFLPVDQDPASRPALTEREHGSIGGEWVQ